MRRWMPCALNTLPAILSAEASCEGGSFSEGWCALLLLTSPYSQAAGRNKDVEKNDRIWYV
jgi:hypothetical protein